MVIGTGTGIAKISSAFCAEEEATSRLTVPEETQVQPEEAEVEEEITATQEVETAMMIH